MKIHPSSVISSDVELADDVVIGPFCYLVGKVKIGRGNVLESHVRIGSETGIVEIGDNNRFFAGCAVGGLPQDLKYGGEPTKIILGNSNTIRECVTLSIGTTKSHGVTEIGNNNLLMAYTHVGHDCKIGNHNVLANSVNLAGHVEIGNYVTIGGMSGASQFSRLGDYCYIGGFSAINKDIVPYCMAVGSFATIRGTNKIGLQRRGFTAEEVQQINRAMRIIIMGEETTEQAIQRIKEECDTNIPAIKEFIAFVEKSDRGIAR